VDIDALATQLGALLGVQPSTLVLYIMIVGTLANVTARLIPDTATGTLAGVRRVASIIGAYVPTRIAPGVTVNDVAKAALDTPPIPQKVEADQTADTGLETRAESLGASKGS
jgi:hypothetical protein